MRQNLPSLIIVLLSITFYTNVQAQNIIYVDSSNVGGPHDGMTWATAFDSLHHAIDDATFGDRIFVAKGTYQPVSGGYFYMKDSVIIFGGFSTTDNTFAQRDWKTNRTVLKGNGNKVFGNMWNDRSAILDGFTITGGSATEGGGMTNSNSSPVLRNIVFSDNSAVYYGGGMSNRSSSSPLLMNVTFSSNSSPGGGGIYNNNSSPLLFNVTFSNNSSSSNGGAIYNYNSSSPLLTNVTFSNNNADSYGGAMFNSSSTATISNSVFKGNTAASSGEDIYDSGTMNNTTITYSFTQTAIAGAGNIQGTSNPFVEDVMPKGPDGIWMTADDGLHLICNSLAVDAGMNDSLPVGINQDITGLPRINNTTVDMGAYESSKNSASYPRIKIIGDTLFCSGSPIYGALTTDVKGGNSPYTYLWQDSSVGGTIVVNSLGSYSVIITDANGCTNTDTVLVTTAPITTVTQNGATFTAVATNSTFQWLDCNINHAPISGETNASYTATINGSYAVEITENTCVDTSACFTINNVGIKENSFGESISVYPNPTRGKFTIDLGSNYQEVNIRLTDITGKTLYQKMAKETSIVTMQTGDAKGIYILHIHTKEGAVFSRKLIKE